jgi:hypothetical protein
VHNTQCDPATRPVSVQSCSTGISCTSERTTTDFEEFSSVVNPNEGDLDENIDQNDDLEEENENDGQHNDKIEEEDDDSDMQADEPRGEGRSEKLPLAYQYRIPRAERLVEPNAPNEPT